MGFYKLKYRSTDTIIGRNCLSKTSKARMDISIDEFITSMFDMSINKQYIDHMRYCMLAIVYSKSKWTKGLDELFI